MNCEKSIKIVNEFIDNILSKRKELLFNYCLTKHAYTADEYYNKITKIYPELNNYYKIFNTLENSINFRIRNSSKEFKDASQTQISYAIYHLLWKNSKLKLDCNFNSNGEIIELVGKNNINYCGDRINLCNTCFGFLDEKIQIYCKGDKEKYDILKKKVEYFRLKFECLGNFMPIPQGSLSHSKEMHIGLDGQFDLYLKQVKIFYKNKYEYNEKEYVSKYFFDKLKENQKYFELYSDFDDFIKDNYLDSYLDNYGNVKELFKRENNKNLPESFEQAMEYIDNAKKIIDERTKLMEKELFYILELNDLTNQIIDNNQETFNDKKIFYNIIDNLFLKTKLYNDSSFIEKYLITSGKTYLYVSDEKDTIMNCIHNLFKNNGNSKLVTILKDSKSILIKFLIGKDLIDKIDVSVYNDATTYISNYINADCHILFDKESNTEYSNLEEFKNGVKVVLIAMGCEEKI